MNKRFLYIGLVIFILGWLAGCSYYKPNSGVNNIVLPTIQQEQIIDEE